MKLNDAAGRSLKHRQVAFKAKEVNDDGTFSGYASVFGNVDSYGEIVAPGAFADSLKLIAASGDPLPVLWQHNADQPIGGSDVLAEDDHGLKTDGFLIVDAVPLAAQAHALLKRRVVRGLSIGYYVDKSSYDEQTGIRTLQQLDLVEYSIVTFPANTLAQVESVKALVRQGRLPTFKEFEDFLCEAGFSKTQAKAIAGNGLRKLLDRCEADGKTSDALEALKSFKIQ
jgi:HK97 family phage prohead protease